MYSTANFEWAKPVSFSADFANTIAAAFDSFADRCAQYAVVDAGLNPAEIKNHEDIVRLVDGNKKSGEPTIELARLAMLLRDVRDFEWKVSLSNSTVLHKLSISDVLNLPNSDVAQIVGIEAGNNSSTYSLSIKMKNKGIGAAIDVSARGPNEIVRSSKLELEEIFSAYSYYWWVFRSDRFWNCIGLIFISSLVGISIWGSNLPEDAKLHGVQRILGSGLALGFLVPIPLGVLYVSGVWSWIFPKVDVLLGAGLKRSKLKGNIRNALWSIPALAIFFPLLTNWIYERIF